jgi:anti-sigma-K factor RskA
MTRGDFEQGLDRWGADLGGWPAEEAERARVYLATDGDARRLLDAARQVDAFLGELRQHAAPGHLAGRILARVRGAGAEPDRLERMLGWLSARLWRPALLAMLVTTAGFLTGMAINEPVDSALAEDVMTLAFSDLYAELEDAQP